MSVTYTGNPFGPHLQKSEPIWKRGAGWQTRQTWEGTSASIKAHVPFWIVDAESIELDLSGPTGVAYVTYAKDAEGNPNPTVETGEGVDIETVWDLKGNNVVKDIYDHKWIKRFDGYDLMRLKRGVQQFNSGEMTQDETSTGLQPTNLNPWYNLIIKGQNTFYDPQWVLRRTVTVNRGSPYQADFNGVNMLWDFEDIPSLPSVVAFDLSNIPEPTVPTPDEKLGTFRWAWLRQSPDISRSSNGRSVITDEWWLDVWSCHSPATAGIANIKGLYDIYSPTGSVYLESEL
jgi:hypothetical protein